MDDDMKNQMTWLMGLISVLVVSLAGFAWGARNVELNAKVEAQSTQILTHNQKLEKVDDILIRLIRMEAKFDNFDQRIQNIETKVDKKSKGH